MYNLFFYFVLLLFSIYSFIRAISYAKYEINAEKNKSGAIFLIVFSTFSIIISHIFVLLNQ